MDKLKLRQDVLDELEYEASIDAANIGVSVDDGVVTLTGHVPTFAQKTTAVEAAHRVKGVRGVADRIDVRYPGGKQQDDDQIARRALDVLRWDATVPAEAIEVTVRDGRVTLSGQVQWQFQRQAAEAAIRKLSGVIGINNLITIRPVVIASDIKSRIEAALKRRAEVEAWNITIQVYEGGWVALEGKVDNWEERKAVEDAVWSAPGVSQVEDHLRIA
jgi:osmotically-inducible protein OsmY